MDIKFTVDVKKKFLQAELNGKVVHQILDAQHFLEIQEVCPLYGIQDYVNYSRYLKWQGFWNVDVNGMTYEINFKNNS